MTTSLSDEMVARFSQFIAEQMGLHFPPQRARDLEKGIQAASRAFDYPDAKACVTGLMASPLSREQIEILASILTVGETYFFRDREAFRLLEEEILPPIIYQRRLDNDRSLRLWSAGCATGEEAYSIAIILHKLLPDIASWNITLLATDINPVFLRKLAHGVYTEWSFRDVPAEIKKTYFQEKKPGQYSVLPHLQSLIEPFYLNLCQNNYPSIFNKTNAMDVIFCRNVLMYFSQEMIQTIVGRLNDSLSPTGWLTVGASEGLSDYFPQFHAAHYAHANYFQKQVKPAPIIAAPVKSAVVTAKAHKPVVVKREDDFALAQVRANEGNLTEALHCCDRAVSANKTSVAAHYLRAMILVELGDEAEAMAALRKVLYLDQDFIPGHVLSGNLCQKRHETTLAEKHFRNALALLTPLNPETILPESGGMTAARLIEMIRSSCVMEQSS